MEHITQGILIVKVGTTTLTKKNDDGSEQLDVASFERIGKQIIDLQNRGFGVIIVSSAAITAGMAETGLTNRPTQMAELQVLASIGWRHILNAWSDALASRTIGELLLTHHELDLTSERDELLRVTHALVRGGNVAVANENDAITHEQIAFGDNDSLAATFAARIARSDLFPNPVRLVLLTDVDGVYADKTDPVSAIANITNIDEYQHLAGASESRSGTGGMTTKFEAARIATTNNVTMWVANGQTDDIISLAMNGTAGTMFTSQQ